MADRDTTVEVSIVGKADPSLQAATAAASAEVKGFGEQIKLSQAEGKALMAALGSDWDSITPKALAAAAATGTLAPALAEVAGEAAQVADAVGEVSFDTLQGGIDKSLRLDQAMNSASASAKAFQTSLSANAGFDAATRDMQAIQVEIDNIAAKEAQAVKNASLGQQIANTYAGVKTEFASAAASALAFEAALQPQASQANLARDLRNAFADEATAAASIGDALASYGSIATTVETSTTAMHGSVSTATREFRALFDELSSGRTRQTPGTIAILATRVFGLGPAALAALAGFAALTGGLAYYIYRVNEAAEANLHLEAAAKNAGNFDIQKEQIEDYTAALSRFPTVTKDAAREVIDAYASMRNQSEPQMRALMALTAEWAFQTGQEAPDAAKKLAAAFNEENLSAQQLKTLFPQINQAQLDGIAAAQRNGDMHTRNAEILKVLNQEVLSSVDAFHEHNAAVFASASTTLRYLTNAATAAGFTREHTKILDEQTQSWKNDESAVLAYIAALGGLGTSTESVIEQATKAAESEDTFGVRIRQTRADIDLLKQGIAAAKAEGDPIKTDQLEAGLKAALANLDKLQAGQDRKDMFGVKMAGEEAIQQARETVSEINATEGLGAQERLQKIQAVWNELLNGEKLTAKQRAQVVIEMNQAIAAENKEVDGELKTISNDSAETDVQLSRMVIETKKKNLQDDLANHRVTAAEKETLLQQYVMAEYDADMTILLNKYAAAGDDVVLKEKTLNQIKVLEKQNELDIADIRRQGTQDYLREQQQIVQAKQAQIRGLLSAEDGLVRGIFNSNQTLSQSLIQLASDTVQKELAADLRYLTQRLFFTQAEIAANRGMEQGGLLFHTTIEAQKTLATAAGAEERVAAEQAAQAQGQAASAAAGSAQIMNDAYKAAAGAYQALVGIPYVGPFIAPVAAGVAFAAVAAFDVMTSAEGGAYEVNGGFYRLHEEESVMPANIANPMREFFENGAAGGVGGGSGDPHLHLHIHSDGAPVDGSWFNKNSQFIFRAMKLHAGRLATAANP